MKQVPLTIPYIKQFATEFAAHSNVFPSDNALDMPLSAQILGQWISNKDATLACLYGFIGWQAARGECFDTAEFEQSFQDVVMAAYEELLGEGHVKTRLQ